MKVLKHIFKQPFVFATGLAALIHSTWALGTLFAGEQPEGWHLVGWLIPALLIAFALDVGQIVTSAEIRASGLSWARGLTFLVFALATYYLQWLYIAHHMPALALAAGISPIARSTAVYMRDAALWVIPALLPLSTLLYTFSGGKALDEQSGAEIPQVVAQISDVPVAHELLNPQDSEDRPRLPDATEEIVEQDGRYIARFGVWEKSYNTLASAQRGLGGYKAQMNRQLVSQNGHSKEKMEL